MRLSVILDTILLDADIESLESSLDKIDSEVVLKCRTLYEIQFLLQRSLFAK
jgi:hypothetical protein